MCDDYSYTCRWGSSISCYMNSSGNCTVGNTTLYQGGLKYHEFLEVGEKSWYSVRRVDNLVEYKAFSSF